MENEKISTIFIALIAIAFGYVSYTISLSLANNFLIFVLGLVFAYVTLFINSKITKEEFTFKMNQTFWMYLLTWLVSWSFFMNLYL